MKEVIKGGGREATTGSLVAVVLTGHVPIPEHQIRDQCHQIREEATVIGGDETRDLLHLFDEGAMTMKESTTEIEAATEDEDQFPILQKLGHLHQIVGESHIQLAEMKDGKATEIRADTMTEETIGV